MLRSVFTGTVVSKASWVVMNNHTTRDGDWQSTVSKLFRNSKHHTKPFGDVGWSSKETLLP